MTRCWWTLMTIMYDFRPTSWRGLHGRRILPGRGRRSAGMLLVVMNRLLGVVLLRVRCVLRRIHRWPRMRLVRVRAVVRRRLLMRRRSRTLWERHMLGMRVRRMIRLV